METAIEPGAGSKADGGEERKHFEAHFLSPRYFFSGKPDTALVAKRADENIPASNLAILPVQRLRTPLLHVILETPVPKEANFVCVGAIPFAINPRRIPAATGQLIVSDCNKIDKAGAAVSETYSKPLVFPHRSR